MNTSKKTSILWIAVAVLVVIIVILLIHPRKSNNENSAVETEEVEQEMEKLDSNDISVIIDAFIAGCNQYSSCPWNFLKDFPWVKIKDKSLYLYSGVLSATGQTLSVDQFNENIPSDIRLYGPNAGVTMIGISTDVDFAGESAAVQAYLTQKYGLTLSSEQGDTELKVSQYLSETGYTFIIVTSYGNRGGSEWIYITKDEDDIARVLSENAVTSDSDTEDDESAYSSNTGSDWDSILDEFEQFVDKYISLLKKAKAGDLNAYSEYASYLEKAESLSEKLSEAESEMTSAQISRYMEILKRMTTAAANL